MKRGGAWPFIPEPRVKLFLIFSYFYDRFELYHTPYKYCWTVIRGELLSLFYTVLLS